MAKPALCLLAALGFACPAAAENLLEIYHQALLADPELKGAADKLDLGSAQTGQAMGQMLPQVTGTANWSANDQQIVNFGGQHYKGTRYYVSLNQTLIDFGKFWDWKRAQRIEDQYTTELLVAQHNLLFNVVERYFDVLAAADQLNLTLAEIDATQNELEQVKKQFDKQLIKITDLYETEARLDQLKAEAIAAESQLIIARQALTQLTGQTPQQLSPLQDEIDFPEIEGKLEDWIAVAQGQNPGMAAQKLAIEAASDNVVAQRAKHLPVVDLQLYFYDTDIGFQSSRTSHTQTQAAAINVNVPIFTGGTTMYRVDEAQSRLEIAKDESEIKLRELVKETSDAFSASNADARRIKASEKALASAVKSREAMQKGLKFGVETVADLLRAQQQEYKAKRDLAGIKYNYITNRIRFLKAIGSISEDNIQEVNQWLTGPLKN
ncbi:TolC family outer membrane protein [Methylomonas rhizoryzae]|uniref:TolC family outer membrane protein n=1 Tax=Methylomonas rhizoryzae TaxID=2608981 RepID=UPI001232B48F|nr:TolC family outer membrane protein [Methylomonas rhizoryzae]